LKDDRLYLIHIGECIHRIEEYLGDGGKDAFMASRLAQDAIVRNLQTLSESASRISDELKEKYPAVEWFKIRGFRNVLVHDYLGVDLDMIWNIVERELPGLKVTVERMLTD
jgi:uncharacterized protein with HEPN domain